MSVILQAILISLKIINIHKLSNNTILLKRISANLNNANKRRIKYCHILSHDVVALFLLCFFLELFSCFFYLLFSKYFLMLSCCSVYVITFL